ncbi:MAG TPA: hypothetical protein VJW73_18570, partial [Gemmatimonadaceae bacterium]|nr:hypothetical protein [Gemmatimonadaceae bacterium]
ADVDARRPDALQLFLSALACHSVLRVQEVVCSAASEGMSALTACRYATMIEAALRSLSSCAATHCADYSRREVAVSGGQSCTA